MKNLTQAQIKKINNRICGAAKGLYSDEHWAGQKKVTAALDEVCGTKWEWHIISAHYNHDENNNPCRKVWHFMVTAGERSGIGIIIAAGAGTVADPLSVYDIVAYI